jgi:hypothetical protein
MTLPALLPGYARRYVSLSGGCVDVHETHGKQELQQNLPIAVFLADRGEHVRLLPVLRIPEGRSVDAVRSQEEWEFKVPERPTANAIDQALRNANRQAAKILLRVSIELDIQVLGQAIYSRVRRANNISEVAVLLADELYHFFRQEILNNTFRGKMR